MRILTSLAAAALAAAVLTSCSGDSNDAADSAQDPAGTSSSTAAPTPEPAPATAEAPSAPASSGAPVAPAGTTLTITVAGDSVSPNGERLELAVGEPLTVEIDSDRAGELHVHSKPEQYVNFEAGTSTQELVVERPGLVEMEDHDTGDVVAQIEVR